VPEEKSKAEKDLESVTAMGKRMQLKGKELQAYIHDHMTGFGYKPKTTYTEPDEDDRPRRRWGQRNDDEGDDL
jgi:hypothetical protein